MIYGIDGTALNDAFDMDGESLLSAYDVDGSVVWTKISHAVSNSFTRSLLFAPSDVPTGIQGIACDSITQTIAQLYAGNIYMISVPEGNVTHVASAFNLGHGSTGMFYPSKTDEQDYPLLYVNGPVNTVNDNKYAFLLVVQCTSSSSTMKKIYAVPAVTGITGTSQCCVDFANNIVYYVAASTYYGETDYTYITAWDLTQSEPLQGASYSPSPQDGISVLTHQIDSFRIPFVHEMQSVTFFDGLLAMLSDVVNEKYICFVDVMTHSVYLTINHDIPAGELEGIGFLLNPSTQQYDMIVSNRSGDREYYRYVFNLS